MIVVFFFNDTATTEIYTLSLHDALPISVAARYSCLSQSVCHSDRGKSQRSSFTRSTPAGDRSARDSAYGISQPPRPRSEEHTSELQSRQYLVCRLLLEKKKKC